MAAASTRTNTSPAPGFGRGPALTATWSGRAPPWRTASIGGAVLDMVFVRPAYHRLAPLDLAGQKVSCPPRVGTPGPPGTSSA